MNPTGATLVMVMFFAGAAKANAAAPGAPVDSMRRNETFAPASTIHPDAVAPLTSLAPQDQRIEAPVTAKRPAAEGDRRAAIDVTEAAAKIVRPMVVKTPEAQPVPMSAMNRVPSAYDPAGRRMAPPLVAKYQDGLGSALTLSPTPTIRKQSGTGWFGRLFGRRKPAEKTGITVVSAPDGKNVQP